MQDFTEKWWLKQFKIPEIWAKGITGAGIKIAVLDTGISFPHEDLALDEQLLIDCTASPAGFQDLAGHGTHCVGIIKAINNDFGAIGIAYNSIIYVAKVTHDTRGDKNEYLIKAIRWAIANNVDIISISKGRPIADQNLELAIREADAKGILVVAAAGNKKLGYPSDHIYYPALYKPVLSVGGIDETQSPLIDSLLTNETQIFAPGKEILSTYKNNGYATLTGSSQATPYVAAVCALLLESERKNNPAFIARNIREKLFEYTVISPFGKILELSKFI